MRLSIYTSFSNQSIKWSWTAMTFHAIGLFANAFLFFFSFFAIASVNACASGDYGL